MCKMERFFLKGGKYIRLVGYIFENYMCLESKTIIVWLERTHATTSARCWLGVGKHGYYRVGKSFMS